MAVVMPYLHQYSHRSRHSGYRQYLILTAPQDRQLEIEMVSVVVSIQTRKMLAETRRMFVNARKAEQDVRKGGLVRTSEPNSCSCEAA